MYKKQDIQINSDTLQLITQSSLGLLVLDYLFPNLHSANAGYYDGNSMIERFYNDKILSQCLKGYMKRYAIQNMRTAFFQLGRMLYATATNFAPMRARAIYERYAKPGATIYDYSCGFGGRMLGCLANDNNYTYVGCDPNTETYEHLLELKNHIETAVKHPVKAQIYCECSENLKLPEKTVDFAFSCPPFFGLERYTTEETQSYNRYKKYDEWLENYVRPTIMNIRAALKDDGLMAVDIMDFNWRNTDYHLVADWKRITAECGFELFETVEVLSRGSARRKTDVNPDKLEKVYIFKKGK